MWATVMSRPAEDRAIVDAGLKALAFDSGPPPSATSPPPPTRAPPTNTDASASPAPPTAQDRRQDPGHSDPTVNLYDWYVAIRANPAYFVVDGSAMTAETRADGELRARPYRWARVAPRT